MSIEKVNKDNCSNTKKNNNRDNNIDDNQDSIFVIIRNYQGKSVQPVWDEMKIYEDYKFDCIGASSMYLGRECQFSGPKENTEKCLTYLRSFLNEKFQDPNNNIVD